MNIETLINTRKFLQLVRRRDFGALMSFDKPFYMNYKGPVANRVLKYFKAQDFIAVCHRHQLDFTDKHNHTLFNALFKASPKSQEALNFIIDQTTDFTPIYYGISPDPTHMTFLFHANNSLQCQTRWQRILDHTPPDIINNKTDEFFYNGDCGRDNCAHFLTANNSPHMQERLEALYQRGVDFTQVNLYDNNTPLMMLVDDKSLRHYVEPFVRDKTHLIDFAIKIYQEKLEHINLATVREKETECLEWLTSLREKIKLDQTVLSQNSPTATIRKI